EKGMDGTALVPGCGWAPRTGLRHAGGARKGADMSDDLVRSLTDEVRRLADIEAIEQLKAKYFRYVDAQDWDAWRSEGFTEAFVFDAGGRVREGRETMIEFTAKRLTGGSSVHHGHTPEIHLTGPDHATGTWAMHDYVLMHTKDGRPMVLRGYGHYHEDYVR